MSICTSHNIVVRNKSKQLASNLSIYFILCCTVNRELHGMKLLQFTVLITGKIYLEQTWVQIHCIVFKYNYKYYKIFKYKYNCNYFGQDSN